MSDGLRERILRSVTLEKVIEAYLPLTRQGSGLVGLCPFHDDRHPSLRVHTGKQLYKCFACDAGGDLFSFVCRMENCSFKEALRIVASRHGILSGEEAVAPARHVPVRVVTGSETLADPLREVAIRKEHACFLSMLSPFEPGLEALREEYRRFEVGVAPRQVPFAYEKFGERLIFPLRDESGRLCGFAG